MATQSEQIVVTGRVVYADVIDPSRFKTFDNRDQWSIRVLIAREDQETLRMLARTILADERAQTIFGNALQFIKGTTEIEGIRSSDHQPLKDGNRVNQEDHKGHVYLQAKTVSPPSVVDGRVQPIMQKGIIYDGCWCNVAIAVKSYSKPVPGISWFLNAVQFNRDGPKISIGPAVGDIFKPIEQTGEAGPGMADDPFGDSSYIEERMQQNAEERTTEDLIG